MIQVEYILIRYVVVRYFLNDIPNLLAIKRSQRTTKMDTASLFSMRQCHDFVLHSTGCSSPAAHALAAVMAEVAVAVPDGDGSAAVAGGGIGLEAGELLAAVLRTIVLARRGIGREEWQWVS